MSTREITVGSDAWRAFVRPPAGQDVLVRVAPVVVEEVRDACTQQTER